MPAVVSRTVAPSGGDYTSLEAFNVGEQRDLVTLDEIARAVCEAFEDTNTQVTFSSGWTTDADRHVHIVAAAGAEAQMPWEPTTAYRLVGPIQTGGVVLQLGVDAVVERIQVELRQYSFAFNQYAVSVTAAGGTAILDGLVIRGVEHVDNTSDFRGIYVTDLSPLRVVNCFIIDFNGTSGADAIAFQNSANGATRYLFNNTVINCNRGIEGSLSFSPVVAKNNLVDSRGISGAVNYIGSFDAASTNNASDLADAPGTNNRDSQTFTYEDAGAGDWRLATSDAGARNHGADLSADAVYAFDWDFLRTTRPEDGSWDIGAHEVAAAGLDLVDFADESVGLSETVARVRQMVRII